MLRSILRNVQHYLLFFSILLVLLAFQRLSFFTDQGILAQPYGFDHPGYSSPENAGRVGTGDESKEIGVFEFRLGLFHFALPTFSKEDSSWERTHELSSVISVPLPPNKRRQNTNERPRLPFKIGKEQGKANQETARKETKKSIAYVVVAPKLAPITKSITTLPGSVRRAHANSSYNYQLYALTLNGAATASHGGGALKRLHDVLKPFKVIDIVGEDINLKVDRNLKGIDTQELQVLPKVLKQHDIIVQISLDSFLLRPLESLFDDLLSTKDEETEKVDVFVLEPSDASSPDSPHMYQHELIVFRSSCQEASDSYMKRLQCLSTIPSPFTTAKKKTEIGSNSNHCESLAGATSFLDRCLYDAGNHNIDRNCSHVSVEENARVMRATSGIFPGRKGSSQ